MALLVKRARKGAELAFALRTDAPAMARPALPLKRIGLVAHTGPTAHDRVYTLVRGPVFSGRRLGRPSRPGPARHAAAAAMLTQFQVATPTSS
ncbi:MAG: hypothetical protein M3320_01180 [Actinomycetota bacterium]|nr:hypothetical protein [Actinomycetota bacterium]